MLINRYIINYVICVGTHPLSRLCGWLKVTEISLQNILLVQYQQDILRTAYCKWHRRVANLPINYQVCVLLHLNVFIGTKSHCLWKHDYLYKYLSFTDSTALLKILLFTISASLAQYNVLLFILSGCISFVYKCWMSLQQ